MPYNDRIETRIKKIISPWENTEDKNMFGGICHLLNGNMFCGVYKDFLILRLGEKAAEKALSMSHVRPFDITGRAMKGWIMMEQDVFRSDHALAEWLKRAKEFVSTLPPK
jgi:TfoX/Sxy family transcriptional regulator of competence genes